MTARQDSIRARAARWSWRIAAAFAVAGAVVVTVRDATIPGDALVPAPGTAVFTGEFDRGVPVYRLPAITVSAAREPGDGSELTRAASPAGLRTACPATTSRAQDSRAIAC